MLYGQTISYNYTYMDDNELVMGQMDNLDKVSAIPHAFTEDVFHRNNKNVFYYRPMLTISFAIDAMIGGKKLIMFHITNILLHILATWALFMLLAEMNYERMKSFLFSLIFLVHPVFTQAVAWIPGRNDTLLALFLFPSMLFLIRYLKSQKIIHLILHFIFYVLALFSKETAIAIPILGTIYLLAIHKKFSRNLSYLAGGWMLISGSWLWLRNMIKGELDGFTLTDSISSLTHNLGALVPYIGKSVIPIGLSVFPFMKDMKLAIIAGIITLIFLTLLLFTTRKKRWGYLLFAITWFLLLLIPSFIRNTIQDPDFMEHRVYVSLAGLIIFLMETGLVNKIEGYRKRFLIPVIVIILTFSVLTIFHSPHYKSRIDFWSNAVKTSPSHALNYNNLGVVYFLENNLPEAEKNFRKSIDINPSVKLANYNIAYICMKSGRLKEAESYYQREIEINPTYDNAYFSLGILYINSNRIEKAIKMWENFLTINPHSTECYTNLIEAYKTTNRTADAERIRALARNNGIHL